MLSEGGAIGEALTACVTLVRTVSRMGSQVSGDRTALRKSSLAHGAFERFFAAVCAQMGGKICCLSKGLLADRTLVRFFAIVRAQVSLQGGLAGVRFATYMAGIGSRKWIPGRRTHYWAAEVDGRGWRGVLEGTIGLVWVSGRIEGAGYSTHRRVSSW